MKTTDDLQGQREQRISKMKQLKEMGINPYPAHSHKDAANNEVINNFDKYKGQEINLAGRLMSVREHGKLIFADLEDESGVIQLYIKKNEIEADKEKGYLSLG